MESGRAFLVFCLVQAALLQKLVKAQPECELCTPLTVTGVPALFSDCFSAVYVFGDSLEDVGNLATVSGLPTRPYGQTNPGCPKGRFSDGGLLVDFLVTASGLPATRPSQGCECGTNFAFAGATALSHDYFQERNISTLVAVSFDDQTGWFDDYKSKCQTDIKNSLFIVGGGGNDYNYVVTAGFSPSNITATWVDAVVEKIVQTTQDLIDNGARKVVVLNIPQTSCTPSYKDSLQDPEGEDKLGCLKSYGRIVTEHNMKLRKGILELKLPKGTIVAIADRQAFLNNVLEHPGSYGIQNKDDACCGGGGSHNTKIMCGADNFTVCSDPSDYVYFDGVHQSQRFNKEEAAAFISKRSKYLISKTRGLEWSDLCTKKPKPSACLDWSDLYYKKPKPSH